MAYTLTGNWATTGGYNMFWAGGTWEIIEDTSTYVKVKFTVTLHMDSYAREGAWNFYWAYKTTGGWSNNIASGSDDYWYGGTHTFTSGYTVTINKTTSNITLKPQIRITDTYLGITSTASGNNSYTISPSSYTITYNANGGSGAPSSQTKIHGTALKLSNTIPTRSNYTFAGWGTSATATSVSYAAGANYTTNASATLYALWNRTITYNKNNSDATGTMANTVAILNKTFVLRQNTFVKSHYNFSKWTTNANGTGTSYTDKATYPATGANQTLYAQWTIKDSYTIAYNANGGSGAPSNQTKYKGEALTLSTVIPTPPASSLEGAINNFKSWNTKQNGTGTAYSAGSSITYDATANSTLTLYAQYTTDYSQVSFNYTFMNNDGTNTVYMTATKAYNNTYTIPTTAPSRSNYIFSGWSVNTPVNYNDNSSNEISIYQKGEICNEQQDVTFYAIWTPIPYNIIFNGNAPKDNDGNTQNVKGLPTTEIKRYNESYFLPSTIPTTSNYIFRFWATKPNPTQAEIEGTSGSVQIFYPESEYLGNSALTLYAIWELEEPQHIRIMIGEEIPNYGWIDLYSQSTWDEGVNYQPAGANSAHILWFAHSKLQSLKFKYNS